LFNLVCPRNLVGTVDAYLIAHHGGPDVMVPETFTALKPRVAIMNNGLRKGGSLKTYTALHSLPGLEDIWQLHRSESAGDQNFSADHTANLDESTAYWIKLTGYFDGRFQIQNARTGQIRDYSAR